MKLSFLTLMSVESVTEINNSIICIVIITNDFDIANTVTKKAVTRSLKLTTNYSLEAF